MGRQPRFSHADKIVFPRRLLLNGAIEIEKVSGSERERERMQKRFAITVDYIRNIQRRYC